MSKLIATWFYVGLLRPAPGTWGSLAALPFAYGMLWLQWNIWHLCIACFVVFAIGWWATIVQTKGKEDHDPSEIVVDEVVGQWLALAPFFLLDPSSGFVLNDFTPIDDFLVFFLAGFVLFRFFDIIKPWPVSWADQKSTAFGVMLDDVLAGILAAICLAILIFCYVFYVLS